MVTITDAEGQPEWPVWAPTEVEFADLPQRVRLYLTVEDAEMLARLIRQSEEDLQEWAEDAPTWVKETLNAQAYRLVNLRLIILNALDRYTWDQESH